MKIADNCVVTFHYRLSDADGKALEDSFDGDPMAYLHGLGGIIPGLEQERKGREAGATFNATIPPAMAYGERREDAVQRIQKKTVMTKGRVKPGMVISVSTDHGPRQVVVVKAGKFVLDVDTNHPLAGQTLTFDVEVVDVREAMPEERARRHVHGSGGHHH